VTVARVGEDVRDQALRRRVDELPDERDQCEREHDRQEEDALVDPRAAQVLVQLVRKEEAERRRHERQERQPDRIVLDRRPERRGEGRDLAGGFPPPPLRPAPAPPPPPPPAREDERRPRREPKKKAAPEP